MGISLYTIINRRFDKKVKSGIITFGIQLTLNFFWSIIFFGLKNILLAFIEIVVLWFFIIVTILKFWRIDKRASYLLIPYLTWVSFAAVLNFSVYLLNI
jgi:tryptophan-rich sensory protein